MKVARILVVLLLGTASSLSAVCGALTPTTTALSSSPNPSAYGLAVTFTAVATSTLGAPPMGKPFRL